MPKPQTPLAIAEATGALEHNRKRYENRKSAPQPAGELGEPPNHFSDLERDLWSEIAGMTAPGVLTSADRLLVELTTELLRRFRGWQRATGEYVEPLKPVELGHLRACLGSMGLTPADRGRVSPSDAPKPEDPLAILLGSNGQGRAN
jgi:hypothetical protein